MYHKVEIRKKEFLAARLALQHLLKLRGLATCEVYKDEFGKPHVKFHDAEISISHANGFGAAALNVNGAVGIDIEHPRSQIQRIAHKFLNDQERSWTDNEVGKLTMVWSAKEALYKLHGRTQLIFAEQMNVQVPDKNGHGIGQITETSENSYSLIFSREEEMIVVVGFE